MGALLALAELKIERAITQVAYFARESIDMAAHEVECFGAIGLYCDRHAMLACMEDHAHVAQFFRRKRNFYWPIGHPLQ